MVLSDYEIKSKIKEIKDLHLHQKDKDAFLILDDLVHELCLLNIESASNIGNKVIIAFLQNTIPLDIFYLLAEGLIPSSIMMKSNS